jgi:X-X-X-Leu-X-X-Gly heptad repeat protein
MNNTRACGIDGSSIFYDVETIDLKADPEKAKPASAFEAVFLGDVIDEISGSCFVVQENCKSLYPKVTPANYKNWITSVDQENRMSLAHTIEKSNVPILYNTPRLCDPGITISKNWNLRNYIETRLYLFKFKYDLGRGLSGRNVTNCYPSVIFDFRPFNYRLVLPNRPERINKGEPKERYIHVCEWITVEDNSGAEGYTPHMRLSSSMYKAPFENSEDTFDKMVMQLIQTPLGKSNKSLIEQQLYLGNANTGLNRGKFLGEFRKFIKNYDGVKFWNGMQANNGANKANNGTNKANNGANKANNGTNKANNGANNTTLPKVLCYDDVIRVLFYDLLHDGVVKKGDFDKFKANFKNEFISFSSGNDFTLDRWAGAKATANSYGTYKSILKMKPNSPTTKQIPAICKTLGDLSQFMYASKYDTIVASGDKMGIATGLYVNARRGKKVKCMMEDVITGFIIYTGFDTIQFVSKSTCTNSTNSGACKINGRARKDDVAERIRASVPQNKRNIRNKIIEKKPKGLKSMLNLLSNAARNQIPASIPNTLKRLDSFKKYMDVDDLTQVAKILNVYKNKQGINQSTVTKIYSQIGNTSARINTASPSPTNAMNVNSSVNARTKLRNFLNRKNLNKLTENNKKKFMENLNSGGLNLKSIKNKAYNLHRVRVFNSAINRKKLTNEQYNNFVRRIKNNGNLQNIVYEAKQKAPRNFITQSGRTSKKRRMNNY